MSCTKEEAKQKCLQVLQEHFWNGWKQANVNTFEMERIFGGCTAYLFRCASNEYDPPEVLIRFYCDDDNGSNPYNLKFIGDAAETLVFYLLAQAGLGPKLFSVFAGGRVEEYLLSDQLSTEQLESGVFNNTISRKIARFHALDMPICKSADWINRVFAIYFRKLDNLKLPKWSENDDIQLKELVNSMRLFDLQGELKWLAHCAPQLNSLLVFSHNDITKRNILIRKDRQSIEDQVVIIDFGDCYYNYRAFDLADFLRCKTCNKGLDDKDNFAAFTYTKQEILNILQQYLDEDKKLNPNANENRFDLQRLALEVQFFLLLSDLMTILYITLTTEKPINNKLNWEYGLKRIQLYQLTKKSFFEQYAEQVPFSDHLVS